MTQVSLSQSQVANFDLTSDISQSQQKSCGVARSWAKVRPNGVAATLVLCPDIQAAAVGSRCSGVWNVMVCSHLNVWWILSHFRGSFLCKHYSYCDVTSLCWNSTHTLVVHCMHRLSLMMVCMKALTHILNMLIERMTFLDRKSVV